MSSDDVTQIQQGFQPGPELKLWSTSCIYLYQGFILFHLTVSLFNTTNCPEHFMFAFYIMSALKFLFVHVEHVTNIETNPILLATLIAHVWILGFLSSFILHMCIYMVSNYSLSLYIVHL
jgi:hypothetical protein